MNFSMVCLVVINSHENKENGGFIMIQAKNFTDIYRFLERNAELTRDVKITKVHQYGFNDMEGWQYQINFKLVTVDGYRDKLVQVNTNSSWIEEWEDNDASWQENVLDYLRSAFMVFGDETVSPYDYINM
jgi:hypothetical protein